MTDPITRVSIVRCIYHNQKNIECSEELIVSCCEPHDRSKVVAKADRWLREQGYTPKTIMPSGPCTLVDYPEMD